MTRKPKTRGQFALRDLIFVTLVVAMGLGWLVDRQAFLRREREFLASEAEYKARYIEFMAAKAELLDSVNLTLNAVRQENQLLKQQLPRSDR